jgi:hypothetical protein
MSASSNSVAPASLQTRFAGSAKGKAFPASPARLLANMAKPVRSALPDGSACDNPFDFSDRGVLPYGCDNVLATAASVAARHPTTPISAANGAACLPCKVYKHRACSYRNVDRRREPSGTPDHFLDANFY